MPKKKEATAAGTAAETVTGDVKKMDVEYYRKVVSDSLLKTKREGVEDLVAYLDEIGYFTAPCSGGNHLALEGGLAAHCTNVMWNAEKIGVALYGGEKYNEIKDSVVIAALLHDLGKCGDYDKQMYIPNILKTTKKQSEKKPYKRNTELSAVPHAIRSIKIATFFIDLTEDEEWAILCHDGLYDFMKYDMQGHETPLSLIIHWADMWASRVIEIEEGAEDEA